MRNRRWMLSAVWVGIVACCAVFGGCGKKGPNVVPVAGKVTVDGKGVPNLVVRFQPLQTDQTREPGLGSAATTDDQGHYVLMQADATGQKKGAVVGAHQVTFARAMPPSQGDAPAPMAPDPVLDPLIEKYLQKPREVEVPAGGKQDLDIELR